MLQADISYMHKGQASFTVMLIQILKTKRYMHKGQHWEN